jgi:hypothetical protein
MSTGQKQHSRFQETKRFILSVDHQAKRSYDTKQDAEAEAALIAKAFPAVTVVIIDIEEQRNNLARLAPTAEEKRAALATAEASENNLP